MLDLNRCYIIGAAIKNRIGVVMNCLVGMGLVSVAGSKGPVTYRDSTQLNSSVEFGLCQFCYVTGG